MSGSATDALRRAFRVAPALRAGLPLTLVLAVVGTALGAVVPVAVQQIVDGQLLASGRVRPAGVLLHGGIALLAVVGAAWARRTSLVRLARAAATGLAQLRIATFAHLHELSLLHVQAERRGALVGRVTSDVETMQNFMEWAGVGMLLGTTQVVIALVVMTLYRWQLALVVAAGVAAYALLLVGFQRILVVAHDRVRERVADALAAVGEAISGLMTVRAYGMEEAVLRKVTRALERQFRAEYRTGALGAVLFSSAEVFSGVITATVVATGVLLGDLWGLTAGTLMAFLFLVTLLVEPVQMLVETVNEAQAAGAGLRKVLGVLATNPDVADPADGVDLPAGPLEVSFVGVRFRYPTGGDVLGDVTVTVPAGRRVAVVGETGSGKTTFAKLATRLLDPTAGEVRLGGIRTDRIRFASLRSRVAFVPQEGFLFEGSVGENVRYGRPDADDDAVVAAFVDLGLGSWLEQLPRGVATPVGERGGRLSAGERQLVALARAWIAAPDLLVLDEATSAVDPALEVRIRDAIERLTTGRTSLTIAHRLSTAEAADEVIVFHDGRVVERGTHRDLLAAGGVYAALHRDWEGATGAAEDR